jgi:hypothetical protein
MEASFGEHQRELRNRRMRGQVQVIDPDRELQACHRGYSAGCEQESNVWEEYQDEREQEAEGVGW